MTETTIAKEPKETAHGAGDPRPVFALTVAELAEILDVSPRRVRQMRENGELQPCGRGLIDSAHAVNAVLGRRYLGINRRPRNKWQAAGVGWLLGHRNINIGPEHLEPWYRAAERWGLSREEAAAELLSAATLLGQHAPQFQD